MVHTNEDLIFQQRVSKMFEKMFEKRDEEHTAAEKRLEKRFEKRLDEHTAAEKRLEKRFEKMFEKRHEEHTAAEKRFEKRFEEMRKDITAMQGDLKRLSDFADEACSYMRDQRESILTAQKLTTEGELITDFANKMKRPKNKHRVRELLEEPAQTLSDMQKPRNDQNHSIAPDPLFNSIFKNFQGALLKRFTKDSDAHTSQRKRKLIRDILTDQKDEIDAFKRRKLKFPFLKDPPSKPYRRHLIQDFPENEPQSVWPHVDV